MKVDPVHFFNARGHSILTMEYQAERIQKLEAENAELKRRLSAAIKRLRAAAESDKCSTQN